MGEERLYSVRDLIFICNVTRGWLYYYEDKGLIHSERNSVNNYRYYDEEQIFRIDMIKECTELGFDAESIKMILESTDTETLRRSIDHSMNRLRNEIIIAHKKFIHSIERMNNIREATYILDSNIDVQNTIDIVQVPESNIVFKDFEMGFFEDTISYRKEFSKLDKIIEEANFTKLSPHLYAFYGHFDPYSGEFDRKPHRVRAFYRVAEKQTGHSYHTYAPSFKAVTMIHIGDYDVDLEASYKKLIAYARENGIKLKAESVEEQALNTAFAYQKKDNRITKIYIPIDD